MANLTDLQGTSPVAAAQNDAAAAGLGQSTTQTQNVFAPPGPPGGASASATANAAASGNPNWYDSLFQHYLGRLPNAQEVNQLTSQGWNYDRLYQHLRGQPSWIPGVSIGALEDYHKVAEPSFFKWTGTEPTDNDIRELINNGVKTGDDVEKYLTNRPDVIAAHPGAPLGLNDTQWGQHKAAIDSEYMANLGKAATDQQARDAYAQAASPFRKAPAEQFGLSSGISKQATGANQGALISEAQIAPNARNASV
jgi:hypothetical protein